MKKKKEKEEGGNNVRDQKMSKGRQIVFVTGRGKRARCCKKDKGERTSLRSEGKKRCIDLLA